MNFNMMPDEFCPYSMQNSNDCFEENDVRMRTSTIEEINEEIVVENQERVKEETYYKDNVDIILKKIEKNNPGIFGRLVSFGVPYFEARKIVKRIIFLTLNYSKNTR